MEELKKMVGYGSGVGTDMEYYTYLFRTQMSAAVIKNPNTIQTFIQELSKVKILDWRED